MVKSTKSSAKTTRKSAGSKKTSTFLSSLPESVEHIEMVQQVAGVLEELQKRVLDVKEEASKELKKLMNRYETNYKGLEKKVHNVTFEAKKQAQTSMIHILQKWHEHKERLPKPLAKEIEKIIAQIGSRMVAQKSAPKKTAKKSSTTTKKTKPAAAKRATAVAPQKAKKAPVQSRKKSIKAAPIRTNVTEYADGELKN